MIQDHVFYLDEATGEWMRKRYAEPNFTPITEDDLIEVIQNNCELYIIKDAFSNTVYRKRLTVHPVGFSAISACLEFRVTSVLHAKVFHRPRISVSMHSANGTYSPMNDNVTMFTLPIKEVLIDV